MTQNLSRISSNIKWIKLRMIKSYASFCCNVCLSFHNLWKLSYLLFHYIFVVLHEKCFISIRNLILWKIKWWFISIFPRIFPLKCFLFLTITINQTLIQWLQSYTFNISHAMVLDWHAIFPALGVTTFVKPTPRIEKIPFHLLPEVSLFCVVHLFRWWK